MTTASQVLPPTRIDAGSYLGGVQASEFDWRDHLARHDRRLLSTPEGRKLLTKYDPLLWALVYFGKHLQAPETGDRISFSDFHLDLCRHALHWARRGLRPAELRTAWVAPRGSGKTTWIYLILPLWAMAHKHRKYIIAFADSGTQAELHLTSLKRELDNNDLLNRDFPELCRPARRPTTGKTVADNLSFFFAENGAAFQAKGIDSNSLGAKIENRRPDLMILDDCEPDESNYSAFQKGKRLSTIVNAIFPMNLSAIIELVGTTVMPGSIVHDLVRQAIDPDPPKWPQEENIQTRYYPGLVRHPDGTESSLWPQKWSLEYLKSIEHTRSFALNIQNIPVGRDGGYWSQRDFVYGLPEFPVTKIFLWVDPAVTDKKTSDPTGLAVVGYVPGRWVHPETREVLPPQRARDAGIRPEWVKPRAVVFYADEIWATGEELRAHVLRLIVQMPEIQGVVVEVNQGGDLWKNALHSLPVPLATHTASTSKEVRFAKVLGLYQPPNVQVHHAVRLPKAEQQMMAYPHVGHDDITDAVCAGVWHFLRPRDLLREKTEFPR